MRVLVVPGYFGFGGRAPAGSNGVGVFFRDQAVALARAGHDVSLVYVHFDADAGVSIEVTNYQGVSCIFVHAKPWLKLNSLRRVWLAVRACRLVLAGKAPDIVHAHMFHALPTAWALAMSFRVPYVITEHSSKVRSGVVRPGWSAVARVGYARAGVVLAVSQALANAMTRYTRRAVQVVPNLVRDEFFDAPLRPRAAGEFTFLSVGYCDPVKGWDLLLHAFARIAPAFPARLVLCGGECPELVALAGQLGVGDRVSFTGRVPAAEVLRLMAACDCHVMPSRLETFGIASIEALACGKPVIMSATDSAVSIVGPGDGLITSVGDVDALARAMRMMIQDATSFDPVSIRDSSRARFSEAAVSKRLEAVYSETRGSVS